MWKYTNFDQVAAVGRCDDRGKGSIKIQPAEPIRVDESLFVELDAPRFESLGEVLIVGLCEVPG
jgi:hypothetical protein